jgi:hypothetical protein
MDVGGTYLGLLVVQGARLEVHAPHLIHSDIKSKNTLL